MFDLAERQGKEHLASSTISSQYPDDYSDNSSLPLYEDFPSDYPKHDIIHHFHQSTFLWYIFDLARFSIQKLILQIRRFNFTMVNIEVEDQAPDNVSILSSIFL